MSEDDSKKSGDEIRISDRRSFTNRGERRTPDVPKSEPVRTPPPDPRGAPPSAAPEGGEAAGIGFDSFVRYLAQVALHQMTGEPDPATGEMIVSLEEARQTIEILAMLKIKTRGNLTSQEAKTLEDLLYHLKIEFSRRAAAAGR